MSNLFKELRRRNMFRVAGVYAVVGWMLVQVAAALENGIGLPGWFDGFVIATLLIGLPIALLLAWAFELTPEGVKRTQAVPDGESIAPKTGRKLDYAIVGGLGLVAALMVGARLIPDADTIQSPPVKTAASQPADAPTDQSIAVLPFENFSSDADQDYFASGISEELLNALARIKGLKVSSRTSAFAFKGQNTPIAEIAAALNVAHVLEGSVRKSGNTLRITAQLIDTKNDIHLWSQTYDRPLTADNIFAIQDDITAAIVLELSGRMGFVIEQSASMRTASVEAYELYLRARENMDKRQPETLRAAVKGFEQVIALDPDFAPAYAGLAETDLLMVEYAGADLRETLEHARPYTDKALALAPDSAEVLTAAALLALTEGNNVKALAFSEKAIAANPNYALAYHRQGLALNALGQPEKALAAFRKALELDPLSSVLLVNVADSLRRLGDLSGARKTAQDNIRWNPDSPHGYFALASVNLEEGDYATAHSLYKDAQALNPANRQSHLSLIDVYTQTGLFDQALALAQTPDQLSVIYFYTGDVEALRRLFNELSDFSKPYAALYLGDDERSIALAAPFLDVFFAEELRLDPETAYFVAVLAVLYRQLGSAKADDLIETLENYIADRPPSEFTHRLDLFTGASVHRLKGDPEGALEWLERGLDLGYANRDLTLRFSDDLRDLPEFAAIEARNNEILARHRAAIEAQLANPKPDWLPR